MTKSEIIEKAIAKAYRNGWDGVVTATFFKLENGTHGAWPDLFSKKFAQAIWKGSKFFPELMYEKPLWEFHLQNMVIDDDPIEYLERNI